VAHGGQGKIDEKALGAGFFQESAEKDEENDVGGQHVGHDAEDTVALVEDLRCTPVGKVYRRHGRTARA
jgi:hypothetical protein